jgi:hypothetical protein
MWHLQNEKYDDGVNLKNVYIRCDADTGYYDPPSVVPGQVSVKIFNLPDSAATKSMMEKDIPLLTPPPLAIRQYL